MNVRVLITFIGNVYYCSLAFKYAFNCNYGKVINCNIIAKLKQHIRSNIKMFTR